jgi:L-lactate dehydrogenase complex protein LldF
MLRQLRQRQFEAGKGSGAMRWGLKSWARLARRPRLYGLAMRLGVGMLGLMGRRRGRFRSLPMAGGWTGARDLPAPQGRTFQAMWSKRKGARA